jgi:hypothetical protein
MVGRAQPPTRNESFSPWLDPAGSIMVRSHASHRDIQVLTPLNVLRLKWDVCPQEPMGMFTHWHMASLNGSVWHGIPWDVEFWWTVRESLIFQVAFMHRNRWNGQPWFWSRIYGEWLQHEADELWHIRLRSLKSLHPCAIHLFYLRSIYIYIYICIWIYTYRYVHIHICI